MNQSVQNQKKNYPPEQKSRVFFIRSWRLPTNGCQHCMWSQLMLKRLIYWHSHFVNLSSFFNLYHGDHPLQSHLASPKNRHYHHIHPNNRYLHHILLQISHLDINMAFPKTNYHQCKGYGTTWTMAMDNIKSTCRKDEEEEEGFGGGFGTISPICSTYSCSRRPAWRSAECKTCTGIFGRYWWIWWLEWGSGFLRSDRRYYWSVCWAFSLDNSLYTFFAYNWIRFFLIIEETILYICLIGWIDFVHKQYAQAVWYSQTSEIMNGWMLLVRSLQITYYIIFKPFFFI